MTRGQREKSERLVELRAAADVFVANPCRLSAEQTEAILGELSVELGHCLAPTDVESVEHESPTDPQAFAELVLKLKGAPSDDLEVFFPVFERVVKAFERAARAKRPSLVPLRPDHESPSARPLAPVGGPVDEVRVSLAVCSEDLEPEELSALFHCAPTSAHRKGERKTEGSAAFRSGAWILTEEGQAPETPDQILRRLLLRLPDDPAIWSRIADEHDVRLRFGIHMTGGNKGFGISSETLARLSRMRLSFEFDLHAYEPEAG